MKIAIVLTVKNETRLLRQNLIYHQAIGISNAFVYFDNTTDNGRDTVKDLDFVIAQESVNSELYKSLEFLNRFTSHAKEHHTARQCLNTYDALQKCKAQQIDWLIALDADELFLSSTDGEVALHKFFLEANQLETDVIRLKPMEVVAKKMAYKNVMREETLFKCQKNFKSKFDQIYHKIFNPYTKSYNKVSFWLGHTMGKSIIRVHSDVIPYNVHRFTALNGVELKTINKGYLLHYHIYDFDDFINKFQNFKERADTFLSGHKIEDLKSLWIKLVNDPNHSTDYLKAYFKKNLLYDTAKLKRLHQTRLFNILKRREAAVINIDVPQRILNAKNAEKLS